MSKVLTASCEAGVVKIDGKPVEATILSQGTASSQGVALIDGKKIDYVPKTSGDLEDVIRMLSEILNKLTIIAAGLDAVTTSPGGQAPAIAEANVLISQFTTKKDNLR